MTSYLLHMKIGWNIWRLFVCAICVCAMVPGSFAAQTFQGHVEQGELFEHAIGKGLVFRLVPNADGNPSGWTISVAPEDRRDDDFLWVVTPPYRFWNPRYIDVSYGMSAREAVGITQRDFSFVTNDKDYQTADQAVQILLWPYTYSSRDVENAQSLLQSVPKINGTLTILNANFDPPSGDNQVIRSFDFKVDIQ